MCDRKIAAVGRRRVEKRINRPLVSPGHCPLFRCLLKQLTGTSRCSAVSLALRFQGAHRGQHCPLLPARAGVVNVRGKILTSFLPRSLPPHRIRIRFLSFSLCPADRIAAFDTSRTLILRDSPIDARVTLISILDRVHGPMTDSISRFPVRVWQFFFFHFFLFFSIRLIQSVRVFNTCPMNIARIA